jgi:hypothetical protein
VGRILGGGVAARYRGRLLPVRTFLRDTAPPAAAGASHSGHASVGTHGHASPAKKRASATVVAKGVAKGGAKVGAASPGAKGDAAGSSGSVTRLLLRKASVGPSPAGSSVLYSTTKCPAFFFFFFYDFFRYNIFY